jgi:hypothetical protein
MLTSVRSFQLILASLVLLGSSPASAADSSFNILFRADSRELELRHRSNRILVYAFGTNQFKPYVRELYTLDGINVLRDAPADHPHHHGLMYAIQVNGINFWEEAKSSGYQIPHAEFIREVKHGPTGPPHARFSHILYWVPPAAALLPDPQSSALLKETRTITVTVDVETEEIAVQWQSEFEVGPASPEVTLTGTAYHGLGLRLPVEFDHEASRQNSAGRPHSEEGRDEVTEARWTAASQRVAGRVYTIAVYHDPANAGQPRVFSMVNPFAYLSATQGLDEMPLKYKRGEKFTVRHLVTVTSGQLTHETLERRHQRWIQ